MSAMNVFTSPRAVHIATDGAGYSSDGRTVCGVQKVAILPQLPCVIATRGALCLTSIAGGMAAQCAGFDQLAGRVGGFCEGVYRAAQAQAEAYEEPFEFKRAEFVVAGWSQERRRLETYIVLSQGDEQFAAWTPTLFLSDDDIFAPCNEALHEAFDAIRAEIGEFSDCPETAALRVMEAQRAVKVEGWADAPVGVWAQLTTLTRDGITTRILRRW